MACLKSATVTCAFLLLAFDPSLASAAGPTTDRPAFTFGLAGVAADAELRDEIPDAERQRVGDAIAAYRAAGLELPARAQAPLKYPFYPQAGVLGEDLFLNNLVDLDPTGGVLDWDCSGYTYDGHLGHDTDLRSFREQAIGVPVFAVLDGRVVASHDGEPDTNTELQDVRANYVVLDHGGGTFVYYWHLKRGSVLLRPGQSVTTGTQIGQTGSSGFSSGPHLHFESHQNNVPFEPSTGPCHTGPSTWKMQPTLSRTFYARDGYLTEAEVPIDDPRALWFDALPRASKFLAGQKKIWMRIDLQNLPAESSWQLRLFAPDGTSTSSPAISWGNPTFFRRATGGLFWEGNFTPGPWRIILSTNGRTVFEAPFDIVGSEAELGNRPPRRVTARLIPSQPETGQILTCRVSTSLLTEDPDYDVVKYKYTWKVNNRTVRTATSAALTDVLAKGKSKTGDRVTCRVTPYDDRLPGRTAVATSAVP